ncbi:MAG: tetratricopeptide repeat protein [Balneolaceae bacterium]
MKILKSSSLALVFVLMATSIFAQTKTDAINLFNAGLEEAKAANYDAAVSNFTQAITISEELGEEGEDIKSRSERQIPAMYFQKAREVYADYQANRGIENLDATISAFREAADVAEDYNDERIAPQARGVIPQLYYQKSLLLYNEEDYEGANEAVETALNDNPNYALAFYQKAKIHKRTNDTNGDGVIDQELDDLLNFYDQAVTVAEETNKTDVVSRARDAAHDELLALGAQASQNDQVDEAISLLDRALTYDENSADVHFRLAEAYNKKDEANDAVTHATQALENETGGRTDRAKIYFELGYAHQTLGNKSEACDAFGNALFGSFKSPAEHKMEFELKCDSTAP